MEARHRSGGKSQKPETWSRLSPSLSYCKPGEEERKLEGEGHTNQQQITSSRKKKHFSFTQLVGETEMLSVVWSLGENLAATKEERREAMPRKPTSHGHSQQELSQGYLYGIGICKTSYPWPLQMFLHQPLIFHFCNFLSLVVFPTTCSPSHNGQTTPTEGG